jgi:flavin-dependent dehydrogenase
VDADLAIVGGGPAGVATALFALAEAPGLRVVLLEKERFPREKICAGAIGARADRLLESIGVRVEVPAAAVHGLSVSTRDRNYQVRRPGDAPIGRVVRRIEFDHALAEVARGRGAQLIEGARVSQLEVTDDAVRVTWPGGELRTKALVGADGVGSFVRKALGIGKGRWNAQVVEVDTDAVDDDPARDLLQFDVTDRELVGYAWDFPTIVGGRALVCRGIYELRWEGDQSVDVTTRLRARLDKQGIGSDGLRFKRFAERGLSLSEPFAQPRVMLVGEAAGIDPVLGEGIAQAVLYGATAGRYVARSLEQGDVSFADWRRELLGSRVGWDLRVRSVLPQLFYGRTRPAVERWVSQSQGLAYAGMRYFAGEPVPRTELARAAWDFVRAGVTTALS